MYNTVKDTEMAFLPNTNDLHIARLQEVVNHGGYKFKILHVNGKQNIITRNMTHPANNLGDGVVFLEYIPVENPGIIIANNIKTEIRSPSYFMGNTKTGIFATYDIAESRIPMDVVFNTLSKQLAHNINTSIRFYALPLTQYNAPIADQYRTYPLTSMCPEQIYNRFLDKCNLYIRTR